VSQLPESVVITDDTMREGLQVESADIPVSEKLRLLDALGETGAKVISIGSFAHPKWTPQTAWIFFRDLDRTKPDQPTPKLASAPAVSGRKRLRFSGARDQIRTGARSQPLAAPTRGLAAAPHHVGE